MKLICIFIECLNLYYCYKTQTYYWFPVRYFKKDILILCSWQIWNVHVSYRRTVKKIFFSILTHAYKMYTYAVMHGDPLTLSALSGLLIMMNWTHIQYLVASYFHITILILDFASKNKEYVSIFIATSSLIWQAMIDWMILICSYVIAQSKR